MKAMNPYLNFNGKSEEAFEFYRSVFGGEFSMIQRFSDVPPEVAQMPEGEGDLIMHISLPIGENMVLMASDVPGSMPQVEASKQVHISLEPDTKEEADRVFRGLSKGGRVMMPLKEEFWGAYFGMLVDRYGIQWMVNLPLN